MAAVACAYVMAVILDLNEITLALEILNYLLAALIAVEPVVSTAVFVYSSVVGYNADNVKIMPEADLKVVGIVGRRHLNGARAEAYLAVIIANDGYLAAYEREDAGLADQMLMLLVLGVDGNAGVAQHRFGPRSCDDDLARPVGERVADMPKMAGLVGIFDLCVG